MKRMTICGHDAAEFSIVLPAIPEPAEKTAAEFLKRVISISCGAELPISDTAAEHCIMIGTREPSPEVKWDGFRITTDENHVYLDGNAARGTLYAAYSFAERYLGYRLFAPDVEKIPTDGSAEVPCGINIIDNPVFEARRTTCHTHMISAEYSTHARLNDCMPTDETYGGGVGLPGACHTFRKWLPPEEYFDEHPEYFAIHNGVRAPFDEDNSPTQPCLTNPDVLRIVTEKVLAELREHPETRVLELSQNDNEEYCQCERCAAVDDEEGSPAASMLRFVNAVAEAVEKEFPDVLVRTFAYWYTRIPPKHTVARPNVLIRYCTMHACCRHAIDDPTCERNYEHYYKEMQEWRSKCRHMSVWDYITCWRAYIPPFPNLVSLRENMRLFAECGAIHVLEECNSGNKAGGTTPELKAYLTGLLLWNPYMSEEEYRGHIDEFIEAFYGPGWKEIGRYLELEYEATANRHPGCMDIVDVGRYSYGDFRPTPYMPILPDNHLTDLAAKYEEAVEIISKAKELAETEEQRYRIDGIRASLDYMEICCREHIKENMTPEEQAAHEAKVKLFDEEKTARGFRYNTSTEGHQGR
ncbi:MAG: DUF4838 domain-containing protein [Ruminococcaceae bacterium]|nr:DUF4838 domain-containing protein [Oscillospiraceae bacterium]